jgi:hypothetical protein
MALPEDRDPRAPGDYIRQDHSKGTRSVMGWLIAFVAAFVVGLIVVSYVLAPMLLDNPKKQTTVPKTKTE